MGRTPRNVTSSIWDTYRFEKMPCGDALLSVNTVQVALENLLAVFSAVPVRFLFFSLSFSLLFIEPIQGTQAQFSGVERHVRISAYGAFSRMLEWFKCCWIPFDFGLLLVKPARMLPANLGLHLTALNTLTFCIKFFLLGKMVRAQYCMSPWSGCWLTIYELSSLVPSITPGKQSNLLLFSCLVVHCLLVVQDITAPTRALKREILGG